MENQRKYLDAYGAKLGVVGGDLSPWYSQSHKDLSSLGIGRLLRKYNGSLYSMLSTVYPKYKWIVWKFSRSPKGSGDNPDVVEAVLRDLEQKLFIDKPEDWYRVSRAQLTHLGVRYFLHKNR